MKPQRVLVVDDDESLRRVMQMQLEEIGLEVIVASDGDDALSLFDQHAMPLVITDMRLPGLSGLELLQRIRKTYPETTVIIITAFGTVQTAVEAMREGAYDYITKPLDYEALELVVRRALERTRLIEEVNVLRATVSEKFGFEKIIGRSKGLLAVLQLAARAAQTDSTVLIRGETGTGKELLAKAIHLNSRRNGKPFITINCGAIPKDLVESALFGHVRGAFTGAMMNKAGKVELADGGTLFLDEIGEVAPEVQVKLLRLIQNGEIEKVGAPTSSQVDVRLIAATNRNLQAMVEDGTFREDLYYRLAVIPLELPPLRERREDIPELAERLFAAATQKHDKPNVRLPETLLPHFCAYRWPGNVRELENTVERLVVLASGDTIGLQDLPDCLRAQALDTGALRIDLPEHGVSLDGIEKELIQRALDRFNGNQTRAAKYLDISRRTLIYRMEKYGIFKREAETQEAALSCTERDYQTE